jgi:hypothetical protein
LLTCRHGTKPCAERRFAQGAQQAAFRAPTATALPDPREYRRARSRRINDLQI